MILQHRAIDAGVRCPMIVLQPDLRFENAELVTLLGALEALYVPLEVREISADRCYKACQLGVWSPICGKKLQGIVKLATMLESGRFVARDIGGTDAERMTPCRVEEYVSELFHGTSVTVQVVGDENTLLQEYPLFATVNRAASAVPRHRGRIIFLTYEPQNSASIMETLLLVGKGVTYDTGSVDVKAVDGMIGESRHKSGVGACVGFLQVVNSLEPPTVKVVAALCVVRNSLGESGFVTDEIITAKSGQRVRIINADIEGRLCIADALFHIKEMALCSVNPHIFTIATVMTGAKQAVGSGYSIVIDNVIARNANNAETLEASGELMGDPFEISRIRREDFESYCSGIDGDDVRQGLTTRVNNERSQQGLVAFLLIASGLNKHGMESNSPLKYTFVGITSHISADHDLAKPYHGNPILAMSYCYLIQGKCLTIRNDPPAEMQYARDVDCKPDGGITSSHPRGIIGDSVKNPCIIPYTQPPVENPCRCTSERVAVTQIPADHMMAQSPCSTNVKRNGLKSTEYNNDWMKNIICGFTSLSRAHTSRNVSKCTTILVRMLYGVRGKGGTARRDNVSMPPTVTTYANLTFIMTKCDNNGNECDFNLQ
ncbi:hypothetical protein PV327_001122 [Microctonus hyperodae]|uniref:Cytosol aminopeptidase domain-containing protein n=1 Tax=Microctonus hyperodae TaxID=165561 RepID=A0AA39G7K0_MICHY|nr:hypothetical protein PV327_001122 [Microctonus hyperodae]